MVLLYGLFLFAMLMICPAGLIFLVILQVLGKILGGDEMTTLGVNMTDSEPTVGWEAIQPHVHSQNRLLALSLSAWKLSAKLVDEKRDWSEIKRIQDAAEELERMAYGDKDCTCVPGEDCKLCDVIARLIYDESNT